MKFTCDVTDLKNGAQACDRALDTTGLSVLQRLYRRSENVKMVLSYFQAKCLPGLLENWKRRNW